MKCFKEEKAGYQSKRIWENRLWMGRLDTNRLLRETREDGSIPEKIYYVDLRLGVKMQLKMCDVLPP